MINIYSRIKHKVISVPSLNIGKHELELQRMVRSIVDVCHEYSSVNPVANQVYLQKIMREADFLEQIKHSTNNKTQVVIRSLGNLLWLVKNYAPEMVDDFVAKFVGGNKATAFLHNLNPDMLSKKSKVLNLAITGHKNPDPDSLISAILLYNNYLQVPDSRVKAKAYYHGNLMPYDIAYIDFIMETSGFVESIFHKLETSFVSVKRKMIPRHRMHGVLKEDATMSDLEKYITNNPTLQLLPIVDKDDKYLGCIRIEEYGHYMAWLKASSGRASAEDLNISMKKFLSWKKENVVSARLVSVDRITTDGSSVLHMSDSLTDEVKEIIRELRSVVVIDLQNRVVGLISPQQVEEKNTFAILVDCNEKPKALADVDAWGFIDHHDYDGDDDPYFALLGRVGSNITNVYKDMLISLEDIYFPAELQLLAIAGIVCDTKNLQLTIAADSMSADRRTIESLARRFFASRKSDHFTIKEGINDVDALCDFLWEKYNQLQQDVLKDRVFQDRVSLFKKADQKTYEDTINGIVLQWEMGKDVYAEHQRFSSNRVLSELADYSINEGFNRGFVMVSGEDVLGLHGDQRDELYCFVESENAANHLVNKLPSRLLNSVTGEKFSSDELDVSEVVPVRDSRGIVLGYGLTIILPACTFKSRKLCFIPPLKGVLAGVSPED